MSNTSNVNFHRLVRTPTGNTAPLGEKFDTKHTRSHRVERYSGPEYFQTQGEKVNAVIESRLGQRNPEHERGVTRNTRSNAHEVTDMRYNLGGGKRKSRGKRTKKGKKANKKSVNKRKSAKKGRKSRKH